MRTHLLIFSISLSLAACSAAMDCMEANGPECVSKALQESCDETSTEQRCLLKDAEDALGFVEGYSAYADAAAELASAMAASGRRQAARALLEETLRQRDGTLKPADDASAIISLTGVYTDLGAKPDVKRWIDLARTLASATDNEGKRTDLLAKVAVLEAKSGDITGALTATTALVDDRESPFASFQARALREIAVVQANTGDIAGALATIERITMGLIYYKAQAYTDVAGQMEQGWQDPLKKAEVISDTIENGYFKGGALRDIAAVYYKKGLTEMAEKRFAQARIAAAAAPSAQEQARALSRLATVMADVGLYENAEDIFPQARKALEAETREIMQQFSLYEIAGSAAFAGDFSAAYEAQSLVPDAPFASAKSLYAMTQRDIAWGLARHGAQDEAARLARSIKPARARVQALSRLVRLLEDRDMAALPRYL